jgi:hypothetical protein
MKGGRVWIASVVKLEVVSIHKNRYSTTFAIARQAVSDAAVAASSLRKTATTSFRVAS